MPQYMQTTCISCETDLDTGNAHKKQMLNRVYKNQGELRNKNI